MGTTAPAGWLIAGGGQPASEESVCAFCHDRIIKVKGMLIREYWNAAEPQPGVTLPMECKARPMVGPGAFDHHAPR